MNSKKPVVELALHNSSISHNTGYACHISYLMQQYYLEIVLDITMCEQEYEA